MSEHKYNEAYQKGIEKGKEIQRMECLYNCSDKGECLQMNELVITALNDHKEPCTTILRDGHYELWLEDGRWIVKNLEEVDLKNNNKISKKVTSDNCYCWKDKFLQDLTGDKVNYIVEKFETIYEEVTEEALTEREKKFLTYYYIDNMTYEEIAKLSNITKSRVEQVIKKALRRLRHPYNSNQLLYGTDYVELKNELLQKEKELADLLLNLKTQKNETDNLIKEAELKFDEDSVVSYQYLKTADIDDIGLSVRAYNCLKRKGINNVGDLLLLNEEEFYKIRNLGTACANEIITKIKNRYGFLLFANS